MIASISRSARRPRRLASAATNSGRLRHGAQTHDISSHRPEATDHLAGKVQDGAIAFSSLSEAKIAASYEIRAGNQRRHGRHGRDGRRVGILTIKRVEPASQPETGIEGIRWEKSTLAERLQVSLGKTSIRFVLGERSRQTSRQIPEPRGQPKASPFDHCQNPRLGIDEMLKQRVEFTVESLAVIACNRQRSRSGTCERIQDAGRIRSERIQHLLDELGRVALQIRIPIVQRLGAASPKRGLNRVDKPIESGFNLRQEAELGAFRSPRSLSETSEAERIQAQSFGFGDRLELRETARAKEPAEVFARQRLEHAKQRQVVRSESQLQAALFGTFCWIISEVYGLELLHQWLLGVVTTIIWQLLPLRIREDVHASIMTRRHDAVHGDSPLSP